MNKHKKGFDESHLLHELRHYLPSQTPIKDFIHHNTLHAMQHMKFYDAIFRASKIFGYNVTLELKDYRELFRMGRIRKDVLDMILRERKEPLERTRWMEKLLTDHHDTHNEFRIGRVRACWKKNYHVDLDNLVHPLLFRILCSYLDQGISITHFPHVDLGLLEAVRRLEKNSLSSFFQSRRSRELLMQGNCGIRELLDIIVGDESLYEEYLFDQQFSHHGWSGMVAAVEDNPGSLLYPKKISLRELIILELLLEIDKLDATLGQDWRPLGEMGLLEAADLFAEVPVTELREVLTIWQDAFEWSYYDQVLAGIKHSREGSHKVATAEKSFQAVFCIDERECSLRRHVEMTDPDAETLGSPGFFGVEFFFQPENGKFFEKLCPAPVTPRFLVKELHAGTERDHETLYHKRTHTVIGGYFYSLIMGFWAGIKLVNNLFRPKMSPAISNAFAHMGEESTLLIEHKPENGTEKGLQVGFTVSEMSDRVESFLRGIGLVKDFAPIVYLVSHGSSSANNPHHGAHDCGACSGRPGAVNARVAAFMANHPEVRETLAGRGIRIPEKTQFIGAMHDTASDLMGYYDLKILTPDNSDRHARNWKVFERALDLNAKERSRRFASIKTRDDIRKVRRAIEARSVSFFEPRPELGHGTNALCIVGRRELTQGLFLDRRAFMNSYDHRTDPEGKILLNVMRPLPPVCGGINLEYYFSRVDNQKFGAGTKLPHNVMGLIGVANSSDGDLRPGLPLQMIEVHDPVRLLIIVEHYPDIVLNAIRSVPELYEWFANEWVHLVAMNPDDASFHYFRENAFHAYEPLASETPVTDDMHKLIESAREMETNHILHATQENLPVHLIKK